jgi:signal transduction histidine kinase/CheY-like chemotaxis protein/HPt (histidine-containing phosphotransfer) domain-containing protein
MLHILIYLICLLAGAGVCYLLFKSKIKGWETALILHLEKATATNANSKNKAIVTALPKEFASLGLKIETILARRDQNAVVKTKEPEVSKEASIKKQLNNTLIINELGQNITSSLKLEETFDLLHGTLNSLMDAAVVELGVFDKQKETWQIYSNLSSQEEKNYRNHIAEWVQVNDKTVVLEDAENDFGRYVNKPLLLQNGQPAQSLLALPIQFHGHVGGVISVVSFRKNAFDEYHKESIEQLLGFLSVALENAFSHEQVNLLKIRAEESEKHEQQFLANMSHEIRTPMNAVLGMTNLLLDTKLEEKQVKYLNAINISSKNLLVIINDILDLSKLEAGKMEIEKIPFRVRDVVQNVNDTSRFKAEEKGLRFEVNISPDIPDVLKGDPTRLNQILTNLASNAVKFTDKGSVTISVEKATNSHFIQFRVIDTGIGIPKDKQHLLFGNFKQVDSSTFRKYGGTGLGLAISKTLIELQGGKVNVLSSLGEGSQFIVEIPYEIGTEEEAQALSHHTVVDYAGLADVRILVAEDNEYNQIVVVDTLNSLIKNATVEIAENGLIAVEMVQAKIYDLVLMDAQMPEMDGLEATRVIRNLANTRLSNIPILALTASVHKADIDKCLDSGMNAFVPKPFTPNELLGAISEYYHNDNPSEAEVEVKTEAPVNETKISVDSSAAKITDLSFLSEFAEGNPARIKKYIALYLKLLPDNLVKISTAIDENDFQSLVKVSHSMRPHLNYMGMKEAAEIAAEMENIVNNNLNSDGVMAMARKVREQCLCSKEELEIALEVYN